MTRKVGYKIFLNPGITSLVQVQTYLPYLSQQIIVISLLRYPPGMYSCIAGFLDAGESLEECVRRESAEEVGIIVEKVRVRYSIYRNLILSIYQCFGSA